MIEEKNLYSNHWKCDSCNDVVFTPSDPTSYKTPINDIPEGWQYIKFIPDLKFEDEFGNELKKIDSSVFCPNCSDKVKLMFDK